MRTCNKTSKATARIGTIITIIGLRKVKKVNSPHYSTNWVKICNLAICQLRSQTGVLCSSFSRTIQARPRRQGPHTQPCRSQLDHYQSPTLEHFEFPLGPSRGAAPLRSFLRPGLATTLVALQTRSDGAVRVVRPLLKETHLPRGSQKLSSLSARVSP